MRHPQYDGFLLIMIGFLLQWPTIPTLIMFPILVYVYAWLARSEEREVAKEFGGDWAAYAARTPAFRPRFRHPDQPHHRPTGTAARKPGARPPAAWR
ncbi:hypothetical protein GCM10019016_079180 [Streptomyces prasinosporus]|uniref:Isoprenylcysteine carboxylmethyltransferase family protein n=2 Tax=Streptomyces TaxID=1883 RepID=A0ABP6TZI3_9ACTN|nr:hypothetical protein [Streptomyces tricolor]MCG0062750.1 hypothetical protein [Streptomyces tricolor]GHC13747.1 hypothetical protein GCM10010332_49400 [Streptomyces albogriseolus]